MNFKPIQYDFQKKWKLNKKYFSLNIIVDNISVMWILGDVFGKSFNYYSSL